ncbi:hypothetical protein SBV1_2630030 [Verrucomicrobia bacterium]|nr:hypothetical protein SBV1_2630030 [Verrucomicrobiota bacterium]
MATVLGSGAPTLNDDRRISEKNEYSDPHGPSRTGLIKGPKPQATCGWLSVCQPHADWFEGIPPFPWHETGYFLLIV